LGSTIREISKRTGFSPATVSNALNHKRGVNSETAAAIFKMADELSYEVTGKVKKVSFVIFRANGKIIDDTPFFTLMIDGVQRECKKSGLEMQLMNLDKGAEDYLQQIEKLKADTSSAIILLGTELDDEDLVTFKNCKCPFLVLDYWVSDMSFNSVLINNADSARCATQYLINHGHREIGYLRGDFRIKAFRSRAVGYKIALEKAELVQNPEYEITLSTTMDGAYRDMKKYLEGGKRRMPTAFFSDNDMIALGAMKAMEEFGIRVPEDVSIIGFDDLPFCEISSPRLTTLRVNKQEMGQTAVRRICELIEHTDSSRLKIQICTDFVERDSVRTI